MCYPDRASMKRETVRMAALACAVALCGGGRLTAQDHRGSGAATVGGAALGLYSAGAFGLVGSLLPCDRTVLGPGCSRVSAAAGGALGLVSGAVIGWEDTDQIRDRGRGALYGLVIGGVVGSILEKSVRQYAWNDAVLVAAYGAAVGAAPAGTLLGTGVGAVVGGLAWAFSPRGGIQDLFMFTLVGSALGGLYDWVNGAIDARGSNGPRIQSTFSIALG
jgi:hypothetical protein